MQEREKRLQVELMKLNAREEGIKALLEKKVPDISEVWKEADAMPVDLVRMSAQVEEMIGRTDVDGFLQHAAAS